MSIYYKYKSGIGDASAYQVSGRPFATGSLTVDGNAGTVTEIEFPAVTRWIYIMNNDTAISADSLRIGFTDAAGMTTGDYFVINAASQTERLELKTNKVFLLGHTTAAVNGVSVLAGLTSIPSSSL